MKTIIQFTVEKGATHYTAQGAELPIVTQGKTLDELTKNIGEAVELYLQDEDPQSLGFSSHPSVLVNYELSQVAHA